MVKNKCTMKQFVIINSACWNILDNWTSGYFPGPLSVPIPDLRTLYNVRLIIWSVLLECAINEGPSYKVQFWIIFNWIVDLNLVQAVGIIILQVFSEID